MTPLTPPSEHKQVHSPKTQEVIDELALSSSSEEEEQESTPILSIPDSWNISDEVDLSKSSSSDENDDGSSDDEDLEVQV